MDWIMGIVFLLTNYMVIGIFWGVYRKKEEGKEGMILGVHIPKEQQENPDLIQLCSAHKRAFSRGIGLEFLVGTMICIPFIWSAGVGMILWTLWIWIFLFHIYGLMLRSHRKVYDLKIKNTWIMEQNQIRIDPLQSPDTTEGPISPLWNLLALALLVLPFLRKSLREFFWMEPVWFILPGIMMVVCLMFWGMHAYYGLHRKIAPTKDPGINQKVDALEKRGWSWIFFLSNLVNSIGMLYLYLQILGDQWLDSLDYLVFLGIVVVESILILGGAIQLRRKRNACFKEDTEYVTDEDEYWKNGWYSNPNDPRFLVPDRLNASNSSLNMAKKSARVTTWIFALVTTLMLLGSGLLLLGFDHVKITMTTEGQLVTIHGAVYTTQFEKSDIVEVSLVQQLPDEGFVKTNGGATSAYLVGHFRGRESGKVMLYLYREYTPIIRIQLTDKIIYLNSKDDNQVQNWYQDLLEK